MLLTASLMIGLTACSTYTVIPADKVVRHVEAGQVISQAGWFVPDARMKDILDQLDRCK